MFTERNEPIMKTRRILSAFIAMFPWVSVFATSRPPRPPIILPFAIQRAKSRLTTELQVVEHLTYSFSLRLGFKANDSEDRKRVKKIAGGFGKDKNGNLVEPGIGIPLKLKVDIIDSSGEKSFLEKEVLAVEMDAFGSDSFSKLIDRVEMKPGLYRISVETRIDIPELVGVPVSFAIGYRTK